MRKRKISLLVLLLCWMCKVNASTKKHHLTNVLYSSKTSYEESRHLFKEFANDVGLFESSNNSKDESERLYPDVCIPEQVSLVLRHGSRYSSLGNVKKIAKLFEKIQGIDMDEKYEHLKNWKNPFNVATTLKLSEKGVSENVGIASRYVDMFPEMFQEAISSRSVEMISSNTQRAVASAAAFSRGLLERLGLSGEDFEIRKRDDLLRFFDHCQRYAYKTEEENGMALAEYHKFMSGPEVQEAASRVSARLSSSADSNLISVKDMLMIWKTCGQETALYPHNHSSPWCELITHEESQVLEYAADLKDYWKESHGYSLNYEQSCPLLANVVSNMFDLEKDVSSPKLSFYFGHSETLNPFLALLGLFSDEQPLLASNYELHRESRKFRQSVVASFASNLGFVKYSCSEGPQSTHPTWPPELDSSMVQIIFNEHPIPFPFTKETAVSFFDFETQYYQQIHHCNFEELCNGPPSTQSRDEL